MSIKTIILLTSTFVFSQGVLAEQNTYATISDTYVSVFFDHPTLDNDAVIQILNGGGIAYVSVNQGGDSFYCYISKTKNEVVYEDLRALSRSMDGLYDLQVRRDESICTGANNSSRRTD